MSIKARPSLQSRPTLLLVVVLLCPEPPAVGLQTPDFLLPMPVLSKRSLLIRWLDVIRLVDQAALAFFSFHVWAGPAGPRCIMVWFFLQQDVFLLHCHNIVGTFKLGCTLLQATMLHPSPSKSHDFPARGRAVFEGWRSVMASGPATGPGPGVL